MRGALLSRVAREESVFGGDGQILQTAHVLQCALAGVRPDVRHGRDQGELRRDAVRGYERGAVRRERADVPVASFEGAFSIPIPTVMGIEDADHRASPGHHEAVLHGLGGESVRAEWERQHEKERRQKPDWPTRGSNSSMSLVLRRARSPAWGGLGKSGQLRGITVRHAATDGGR
jgi:hypothetical protein